MSIAAAASGMTGAAGNGSHEGAILKKLLTWLIGIPAAVIVAGLAVANREPVRFSIDPFSETDPIFATELPLFALLLAAVFVGILCGGTASWMSQHKWRRAAREARAEGNRLKQEHETLRRQTIDAQSKLLTSGPGGTVPPATPG